MPSIPRRRIVVLNGHPDGNPARFAQALTDAYAQGARQAGLEVEILKIADLGLPPLKSREEWEKGTPPRPPSPPCRRPSRGPIIWWSFIRSGLGPCPRR